MGMHILLQFPRELEDILTTFMEMVNPMVTVRAKD